jgi:hypothetical protein
MRDSWGQAPVVGAYVVLEASQLEGRIRFTDPVEALRHAQAQRAQGPDGGPWVILCVVGLDQPVVEIWPTDRRRA